MKLPAHLILLLVFSLIAFSASAQKKKQPLKKGSVTEKTTSLIKNGIQIKNTGFNISEAYLVFDDETLVPEDNKVQLDQNVNLLLIIEDGWTTTNGRVFPGSKQVLKLNTGVEILNSDELFAAFDETGVSAEDARFITLNAVVTDLKDKKNHVVVNFSLWDKKGPARLTGSYRLYVN